MALISVKDLSVTIQSKIIFENLSFEILDNRHYAIVGSSGSGKTTLLRCLVGQSFYKGAIETEPATPFSFVEQQHHFKNLSNTSTFYYQQRFNSMDAEDTLTVKEYVQQQGYDDRSDSLIFAQLGIERLWDKRLIQLSNGENKRVQLTVALLQKPRVLLLDNPFLGLDSEARKMLTGILESVSRNSITVILVTSPQLIPGFINSMEQEVPG
jgi:molybdate transport system ATP-binding protein